MTWRERSFSKSLSANAMVRATTQIPSQLVPPEATPLPSSLANLVVVMAEVHVSHDIASSPSPQICPALPVIWLTLPAPSSPSSQWSKSKKKKRKSSHQDSSSPNLLAAMFRKMEDWPTKQQAGGQRGVRVCLAAAEAAGHIGTRVGQHQATWNKQQTDFSTAGQVTLPDLPCPIYV